MTNVGIYKRKIRLIGICFINMLERAQNTLLNHRPKIKKNQIQDTCIISQNQTSDTQHFEPTFYLVYDAHHMSWCTVR